MHCSFEAADKSIYASQVIAESDAFSIGFRRVCLYGDQGITHHELVVMHKHRKVSVLQQGLCLATIHTHLIALCWCEIADTCGIQGQSGIIRINGVVTYHILLQSKSYQL